MPSGSQSRDPLPSPGPTHRYTSPSTSPAASSGRAGCSAMALAVASRQMSSGVSRTRGCRTAGSGESWGSWGERGRGTGAGGSGVPQPHACSPPPWRPPCLPADLRGHAFRLHNPAPLFAWARPARPGSGWQRLGVPACGHPWPHGSRSLPTRLTLTCSLALHHWKLHRPLNSHHRLPNSHPITSSLCSHGRGHQGQGGTSAPCRLWGLQAPAKDPSPAGDHQQCPCPRGYPCWPCPEGTSFARCWPHHTDPEQPCARAHSSLHVLASGHCTGCTRAQGPISSPCPEAQNVQLGLLPLNSIINFMQGCCPSPKCSHSEDTEPRFALSAPSMSGK